MRATAGRDLVPQQMAAEARLGALGVLEFHHAHPLDGVLPHAEQPGGHLGDHVIVIGGKVFGIAALAGAAEGVPARSRRGARDSMVEMLTEPKDMPPPYTGS